MKKKNILLGILLLFIFAHCKNDSNKKNQSGDLKSQGQFSLPDYWKNPTVWQWQREAARTDFIPYENFERAKSKSHPNDTYFKNLNGFWKFKSYEKVNSLPSDIISSTNLDQWDQMSIPNCMEMRNIGKALFKNNKLPFTADYPNLPENNQTTIFRRTIDIPLLWKDRDVQLIFEGVASAFFVYVNGELAGYSEDSRAISEFSIGKFTKIGINEISVVVLKYCDGSYFENHNMWHLHGIYRNVYLISRPKIKIQDFYAKTLLMKDNTTGQVDLEIDISNSNQTISSTQKITALVLDTLKEKARKEITYTVDSSSTKVKLKFDIQKIIPWSDELPKTYDLYITQSDSKAQETESIHYRIGFTRIETTNNNLLFNGQKIKLRGIVVNEFHPVTGYTQDKAWLESDAEQMKMQSINAVRNATYPMNAYWYELCDRNGIYGLESANINLADWNGEINNVILEQLKYRLNNSWERNKNHSHIICWSIGSSISDATVVSTLYQELKTKEKQKLISAYNTKLIDPDILFQSSSLQSSIPNTNKLHLFHTMSKNSGNSLGELTDYWNYALATPTCAGGFVADLADQTFMMKYNNEKVYWAYGGLYGESEASSDTTECSNGIYYGNKQTKSIVNHVRNSFTPFHSTMENIKEFKIKLSYLYKFIPSNDFNIFWIIERNGTKIQEGKIEKTFQPNENQTFKLPIEKIVYTEDADYVLKLNYNELKKVNNVFRFLYKGEDQWLIKKRTKYDENSASELKLIETDSMFEIQNAKNIFQISKQTGFLRKITQDKKDFIKTEMVPYFWRAVTDSDLRTGYSQERKYWKTAHQKIKLISLLLTQNTKDKIQIEAKGILQLAEDIPIQITYQFNPKSELNVDASLDLTKAVQVKEPFRFGFKSLFNVAYGKMEFFGRGPMENYIDRNQTASISQHKFPIRDLYTPIVRPQEQGNRTDVSWLSLTTFENDQILIKSDINHLLQVNVLPFDYDELDRIYKKGVDIKLGQSNTMILCEELAGLGNGDFPPSDKYRLKKEVLQCRFNITLQSQQK
ncbi:MAG: hypothetical protein IPJ43_11965 [Saprospiraceae bacterium]|nr:hypothetical protein [Saprospiraceae bacterium]